jgi:hypothetical protein
MANFFWNDQENSHKYYLANFKYLNQRKEMGGLGIPNLRDLNLCLLASWILRYYDAVDKIWKAILDAKYTNRSPNLFFWNGRNCSPFWKGVIWVAQAAKIGYKWNVGDGKRVRFWED